jgi:hypothetical protein
VYLLCMVESLSRTLLCGRMTKVHIVEYKIRPVQYLVKYMGLEEVNLVRRSCEGSGSIPYILVIAHT